MLPVIPSFMTNLQFSENIQLFKREIFSFYVFVFLNSDLMPRFFLFCIFPVCDLMVSWYCLGSVSIDENYVES
jgi:hypothetical protein